MLTRMIMHHYEVNSLKKLFTKFYESPRTTRESLLKGKDHHTIPPCTN